MAQNEQINWESEYPSEEEIEQKLKENDAILDRQLQAQAQPRQQTTYIQQVPEEIQIVADQEEEDDTELLNSADLRLEQGKLYQLLLKHDLFGEVDADPIAVKNVQKELKNFIKERLNILLGLALDPKLHGEQQTIGQFSDVEVDFLKRVVAKALNNAEPVKQIQNLPQPVKKTQINALKTTQQQPKKNEPKPTPKPQQPKQTQQESVKSAQAQSREEYLYTKPIHELTAAEREERNQIITERSKKLQSFGNAAKRVPMPTPEEKYRIYSATAQKASTSKGIVSSILGKLKADGNLE